MLQFSCKIFSWLYEAKVAGLHRDEISIFGMSNADQR